MDIARTRSKINEMNNTLRIDFAYAGERTAGGGAMMTSSWQSGWEKKRKQKTQKENKQRTKKAKTKMKR